MNDFKRCNKRRACFPVATLMLDWSTLENHYPNHQTSEDCFSVVTKNFFSSDTRLDRTCFCLYVIYFFENIFNQFFGPKNWYLKKKSYRFRNCTSIEKYFLSPRICWKFLARPNSQNVSQYQKLWGGGGGKISIFRKLFSTPLFWGSKVFLQLLSPVLLIMKLRKKDM